MTVLVAPTFVVACTSGSSGPSTDDEKRSVERMYRVGSADDATASEVVEAGGAAGIEASGSGRYLVSYLARTCPESECGAASAWRLYDESGKVVAERAGPDIREGDGNPKTWPLPEAVLLAPQGDPSRKLLRVDDDGQVAAVRIVRTRVTTRSGDVVVSPSRVYRPSTNTVYRLPRTPDRVRDDPAITPTGALWAIETPTPPCASVLHSSRGGGSYERSQVALGDEREWATTVTVVDDLVVVAVSSFGKLGTLARLLVREAGAPISTPWRTVDTDGVAAGKWNTALLSALPGERLLLGDRGRGRFYVGSLDGEWEPVEVPAEVRDPRGDITPDGERLFATGDPDEADDAFVSDDLGENWKRLPR